MTDPNFHSNQEGGQNYRSRDNTRGSFRGNRGPGNRDGGGFRIRLSDNEMRSARALQEALNLRSTVAVLGFALRALGQMLEEGKLDELIETQKSQSPRRENRNTNSRGGRFDNSNQSSNQGGNKPNPFARPPKPEPSITEEEIQIENQQESENVGALEEGEPQSNESQPLKEEQSQGGDSEVDSKEE